MSGAPVSDVKKTNFLVFEMFFFPFGTEPYHAIRLFAKRKQWRMDQISIDVKLAKKR